MKRAFVLSICLLTAIVGMMAQTQNKFWRTTISTTGLYGACDEKGNSTIPNVFQRMGFWGTNAVSFVEYDSRFFVIDRKGEMVGGESWDEEPVIFDRFVMAGNKDERFLMDLHGNRLPVEGTEVTLMKGWNWVADNLMLHSKAADSTYQLHGIDGTLVVNECSTIELLNRLPLVKYLRKGTWGVCNLAGTDVVPCQYSKIEEVNLGAWGRDVELMKKSKVAHMYSRKELADLTYLFAYTENGSVMVYDASGKPVGPMFDDEGTERILRQLIDRTFITYLLNKELNLNLMRSKCEQPRSKFEMRQRDFVHALPRETAGGMSLLDLSQEKVMQINALRRNDLKASNSELEAKKEQIDADFSLNNNKPRAAAKRNDELEPTDIKLPEEGVLPDKFELYYASPDRDRAILINGGKTDSYIFSSSSQAGNVVTVTIGMPKEDEEGWVFEDEGSKRAVVVAKDWSMVGVRSGRSTLYYSLPVTEHDYEIIKASEENKKKK